MSKTYHLETLKDIFDQVPPDRWAACFAAFLDLFENTRASFDMLRDVASPASSLQIQGPMFWTDDGEQCTKTVFFAETSGEVIGSFEAKKVKP